MARTPRTRRAKRTTDFQQPAATARARDRRRQVKPVQQAKSQTGAQRERRGGIRAFAKESWGELKKVEWPSRSQVIQGTIVVIIACAIVGTYLYAADQFFKPFVRNVLLGQ
jgi:preprotein translocase subunit SecE